MTSNTVGVDTCAVAEVKACCCESQCCASSVGPLFCAQILAKATHCLDVLSWQLGAKKYILGDR